MEGGIKNRAWTRARSIVDVGWGGTGASGLRLREHRLFQAPGSLHTSQILRRKRLVSFSLGRRTQCVTGPSKTPHWAAVTPREKRV